jgi:succinyl-diaminopimelate desuccinylase
MSKTLEKEVDNLRPQLINTLKNLIKIPAIAPSSGGEGELKKASYVYELLESLGFDSLKRYDCKGRPNIVAKLEGLSRKTLWFVTHLDIVPPGELTFWKTHPYKPVIKKDKIYGRGSEDNGQALTATIYACKALLESRKKSLYTIGLAIVSDEETGSKHGIKHLIKKKIFEKKDLILVPDGGNESGSLIEVAEKGILWIKVLTEGKQCHASTPEKGINAFKAGTILGYKLAKNLPRKFKLKHKLFSPPFSTFELTKKEANVPNINTIPGKDIFYLDCRIVPQYKTAQILEEAEKLAREVETTTGAKIRLEIVNREESSWTDPSSELVRKLKNVIRDVYGIKAYARGIGGGTCAGIFRKEGYSAIVWSKVDNTCHMPNEYCRIANLLGDAKVYTGLFF